MDAVLTLGKIGYNFSLLGLIMRTYVVSQYYQIPQIFNMSLAQEIVDDLENLQKKLPSASDYLKFCKISEVIKEKRNQEKTLPTLESHNLINLFDYIGYTQLHVSNM